MKKILKRLMAFALVFTLVLTLTGCGEEKTNNGNGTSKNGNDTQKEEKVYGLGEYAKTEHYEVAVIKVTKGVTNKNVAYTPAEGKEFVAIEISIKNISEEDGSVGAGDFQYIGEDGKLTGRYPNAFFGFGVEPEAFGAKDLEIGQKFNGTIIYEMPKDMNEIELWYREGYTTTPDALFKFTK